MMGKHAGNRGDNRGFRATDETWKKFLGHLATMSAIEVSKQPGMPSAPAFIKKRRRDPAFAERAAAAMTARRLNNSGRKRITSEAWASFLMKLPHMSVGKIVECEGMPSMAAVYKRRRNDEGFRAQLDVIIHDVRRERQWRIDSALRLQAHRRNPAFIAAMREALKVARPPMARKPKRQPLAPLGEVLSASLLRNDLYAAASAVVPKRMEHHTRMDIIGDIVLAVLEGEIAVSDLTSRAKEFTRRHMKLFGQAGQVSIDAPLRNNPSKTIGDMLSGSSQDYWNAA